MNIKDLNKKLNKEIFAGKVILIDGPWGSGKTFEVKQFIEKGKGKKYYVSLFGVESFKELTEILYCLLHPVKSGISGKKMFPFHFLATALTLAQISTMIKKNSRTAEEGL